MPKNENKKEVLPNKLNFIDVFSGAGGLSCGLEMVGHQCLLGVDIDKYAMETFSLNHKKANTYCGDISKLTKAKLEKLTGNKPIHAVVGGPPCQGFSTVGLGNPKDERNALFMQFVRLVRVTKPYYIILENVTGLVAKKNESTLKSIFKEFHKLGYNLNVKVMSSQQYGVPEKRRRTIIIGSRINDMPEFPKETHDTLMVNTYRPAVTIGQAFSNLKTKKGEILNHDIESAQIKNKLDLKRIKRIPEGAGIRYEKDEKKYFTKSLKLNVDWETIPENRFRQCKYQRLDRSKPGPTIMTHRHSYYHPVEDRYLTAREAAAIQSFPNDFKFAGPISAQWRQIGNAVPPLLGKALGKTLSKMLKEAKTKGAHISTRKRPSSQNITYERGKAFVYRQKSLN
ncbi:DNA cytosine methyltransferase [Bacteriovoracaceae bacterium]|nr:DNA cytosine methyltransferase [Bacteriovoracaceae bacterium]